MYLIVLELIGGPIFYYFVELVYMPIHMVFYFLVLDPFFCFNCYVLKFIFCVLCLIFFCFVYYFAKEFFCLCMNCIFCI